MHVLLWSVAPTPPLASNLVGLELRAGNETLRTQNGVGAPAMAQVTLSVPDLGHPDMHPDRLVCMTLGGTEPSRAGEWSGAGAAARLLRCPIPVASTPVVVAVRREVSVQRIRDCVGGFFLDALFQS